jgi:hypothetical protein
VKAENSDYFDNEQAAMQIFVYSSCPVDAVLDSFCGSFIDKVLFTIHLALYHVVRTVVVCCSYYDLY